MALIICAPPTEQPLPEFQKLGDFVGDVLVLEGLEEGEQDTKYGPSVPYMDVFGWKWAEKEGKLIEITSMRIFRNDALREQIRPTIASHDQVVGRLVVEGLSRRLAPVPQEIVDKIAKTL